MLSRQTSTYLVNANQRLQGATGATDVQTDGKQKLMQDAAQEVREVVSGGTVGGKLGTDVRRVGIGMAFH